VSSQFWNQAGEWAFKQRSWLPVPIALVLLASSNWQIPGDIPIRAGIALVAFGEFLRFWTVRQIGVISRTRATRWGPLVVSGPYRLVRNPIYVGNWFLWTGFVVWSGLLWMLPVAWLVFGLQYAAIVRWEEQRLLAHFGEPYARYMLAVRRWCPGTLLPPPESPGDPHPWNEVLFSERGTLAAIIAMAILLTLKFLYFR
jgi:protein-S-isoprenylcysteine O-methyltransferase Ste14